MPILLYWNIQELLFVITKTIFSSLIFLEKLYFVSYLVTIQLAWINNPWPGIKRKQKHLKVSLKAEGSTSSFSKVQIQRNFSTFYCCDSIEKSL